MEDATLADFRVNFPEFASVPDAQVTLQLDDYNASLNETAWGSCFVKAVLYRSAHEIAVKQNTQANAQTTAAGFVTTSSGAGAITQAEAGGISASFAQNASQTQGNNAAAFYNTTIYGQQYETLKIECLPLGKKAGCAEISFGVI